MGSKFGFDKMIKSMDRVKKSLPRKVGNQATRFFVDSFNKQGWTNVSFQKWEEPQRRRAGFDAYKYPKNKDLGRRTRPILIGKSGGTKSGSHIHLRQSVNTSMKKATWNEILFVVPQKYARRHNEGLDDMPQRKFIGNSATLMRSIKKNVNREIKKVMRRR